MGDNYEDHEGYEKAKELSRALASHRERRIPFNQLPTAEDQKNPWVTLVWIDLDESPPQLHVQHMRASEVVSHEYSNPMATKGILLRGKADPVDVKPSGYTLETK